MSLPRIHPIPLVGLIGRAEKSKFTHLFNHGQDVRFGYYCWYIEDDGKKILVDAGGTAEQAVENWGRPPETVTHVQTLQEGLARHGTSCEEIDIVILTHLHLDHMAYVHQLKGARFIVQKKEYAFSQNPHPTDRFYQSSITEGLDLELIEGDQHITPNVRVLFTPGHTAGGQSVAVNTPGGLAIVTGFCCIHENFAPGDKISKIMPVVIPGIHQDVVKAYDSMVRVKTEADIIVANHDAAYLDGEPVPPLSVSSVEK
ncbi:MAG: N-acyl homoserine lactonase family protein [Comamonadaceae bacterium]|nr:N-acyl homoserine lactonase family protein [Comamonadaceae bacterium]